MASLLIIDKLKAFKMEPDRKGLPRLVLKKSCTKEILINIPQIATISTNKWDLRKIFWIISNVYKVYIQ